MIIYLLSSVVVRLCFKCVNVRKAGFVCLGFLFILLIKETLALSRAIDPI